MTYQLSQSIFNKSELEKPSVRSQAPNNFSSDDLLPKVQAYGELNDKSMVFKENFFNEFDDVKLRELPDRYVVHFKDDNFKLKELKIDFNKELNELNVNISEKFINKNGEENYFCHYESNIKFDKAVLFDEIVPNVDKDDIEICIPKVHRDGDNTLNMSLKNTSVDALKR